MKEGQWEGRGATRQRLVAGEWLAGHLDDPDLRIIEVSSSPGDAEYRQGHIPAAVRWYWKDALRHATDREFPIAEDMASRLGHRRDWARPAFARMLASITLMGLSWSSTISLVSATCTDLYGRRSQGSVLSVVFSVMNWGVALGAGIPGVLLRLYRHVSARLTTECHHCLGCQCSGLRTV